MNLFEILRIIYEKREIGEDITLDNTDLIFLNKWLSFDSNNLKYLSSILPYLFFIEPIHYFYLLYFNIPHKYRTPFLKNYKKQNKEENILYNEIAKVLQWSDRELNLNRNILDKVIDKEYWSKELGLK